MSPERASTRRLRAAFVAFAVVGSVAAVMMLAILAVQNRDTLDAIEDCTQPGGQCFEASAERQAQVIGQPPAPINDVVILAAACADRPGVDTEVEIRDCVIEGLTR